MAQLLNQQPEDLQDDEEFSTLEDSEEIQEEAVEPTLEDSEETEEDDIPCK